MTRSGRSTRSVSVSPHPRMVGGPSGRNGGFAGRPSVDGTDRLHPSLEIQKAAFPVEVSEMGSPSTWARTPKSGAGGDLASFPGRANRYVLRHSRLFRSEFPPSQCSLPGNQPPLGPSQIPLPGQRPALDAAFLNSLGWTFGPLRVEPISIGRTSADLNGIFSDIDRVPRRSRSCCAPGQPPYPAARRLDGWSAVSARKTRSALVQNLPDAPEVSSVRLGLARIRPRESMGLYPGREHDVGRDRWS